MMDAERNCLTCGVMDECEVKDWGMPKDSLEELACWRSKTEHADTARKYDEDELKPCKTCGVRECGYAGNAGAIAGKARCWKPNVRRPKDMVCMLGKFSKGGMCHGSRCYLWSKLGPEEETGVLGTCVIALVLADVAKDDAFTGVAMEEGEDS